MTPFGTELRRLRAARGMTQATLARHLGVSAAYLSALENGRKGRPSPILIHRICNHFGIIWDDAEALSKLASRSHPKRSIDTSGAPPVAVEFVNLLADNANSLRESDWSRLARTLRELLGQEKTQDMGCHPSRDRND